MDPNIITTNKNNALHSFVNCIKGGFYIIMFTSKSLIINIVFSDSIWFYLYFFRIQKGLCCDS